MVNKIQMISVFFSVVAVIGTAMFFWRFGHSGPWGSLHRLFPLNTSFKCRGSREIVFLKNEERWIGFSYMTICINGDGIILRAPYYLRWFVPSIHIPISELQIEGAENIWFRKKCVLLVGQSSVRIALPYMYSGHFDDFSAIKVKPEGG